MSEFFITIYRLFHNHRWLFFLFLALILAFILLFASRIRLEEDISRLTYRKDSLSCYEYMIRNFKFADKLIVIFSQEDTNAEANPDLLISIAGTLRDSLLTRLDSTYIRQIFLQFNDTIFQFAQSIIDNHLPLFLNETDYKTIDSLMQPGPLESLLQSNLKILISPASIILRKRIVKDPLGISVLAFNKFSSLKSENQYLFYNGSIFSQDKKHLLMFITPANPSNETKMNSKLVANLDKFIAFISSDRVNPVKVEYYGYTAIAVGNANQIKKDIILTLCIALGLIFFLIGWYFKSFLIPMLGFVPAFFGSGLALAILYLFKGSISFVALGIGSVILGLIIDYAIYIVNHYRRKKSVEQVIRDMTMTIVICSLTTIGAFLCLAFLHSAVLHDLGLFTAISVFGASMCSLIILPQFLGKRMLTDGKEIVRNTFIDRIADIDFGTKKWLLVCLSLAGFVSLFISNKVTFEKDMNSLNYMSEKLKNAEKQYVYKVFSENPNLVIFDKQNLTTRFVLNVKHDFELLVTLSMVFVTLLLLISFGRIELALITALPMFLSWLITLGFMGITGIRFNIFNIIVSSFIFGLGVDYSILMMRGLLSQYKTGVNDMKTFQVSIILSSSTTLIGLSALFFARHPALNSIALISIFGVISVVIISFSYQSMITRWLLLNPQQKRSYPMTARNILQAIFIAWIPISLIAIILVIYGSLINPLLPLRKKRKQEVFHHFLTFLSRLYIHINFLQHHAIENKEDEEFRTPSIIICNHQSLIDTPALLRLHPKIIILTNEWVFRNWLFGPVARVAGFIPVADSIDDSLYLMKQRIDDGYSILIFPEGHRSFDNQIKRFHRGAFYIAEKLKIDILPVIMYGGGDFLPKGIFWGKPNRLFTEILPRITPENQTFGNNYSERTKQVHRYYREEYLRFKNKHNTPAYNRVNLRLNYLFKGPVLEWYLRVKMILENDFNSYCSLLPRKGEILDLGCGYGYITYMLMLNSDERIITGVDYDENKIDVAKHGYLKNDRISFYKADVTEYPITPKDGFLFGDILHYLPYEKQELLLRSCINNLKPEGVILIREGNADQEERHMITKFTEFMSTKIIRFNKTRYGYGKLFFTSAKKLMEIAEKHGLTFEMIDQRRATSNNFFVMRMPLKDKS